MYSVTSLLRLRELSLDLPPVAATEAHATARLLSDACVYRHVHTPASHPAAQPSSSSAALPPRSSSSATVLDIRNSFTYDDDDCVQLRLHAWPSGNITASCHIQGHLCTAVQTDIVDDNDTVSAFVATTPCLSSTSAEATLSFVRFNSNADDDAVSDTQHHGRSPVSSCTSYSWPYVDRLQALCVVRNNLVVSSAAGVHMYPVSAIFDQSEDGGLPLFTTGNRRYSFTTSGTTDICLSLSSSEHTGLFSGIYDSGSIRTFDTRITSFQQETDCCCWHLPDALPSFVDDTLAAIHLSSDGGMVYAIGERGKLNAWDTRMTTSLPLLSFEGLSKAENEWAFYSAHGLQGTRFAVCEAARVVAAVCDDENGSVHIWDANNGGRPLCSFSVFDNNNRRRSMKEDFEKMNNKSSSSVRMNGGDGERENKRARHHRRGRRDEVLQRVGFSWPCSSSSSSSCSTSYGNKQCETPGMWVKSDKAMYVIPLGYACTGNNADYSSDYCSGGDETDTDTDSESCTESDLGSDIVSNNSSDSNNNRQPNMNTALHRGH